MHLPINSERLFNVDVGSACRIANFSSRHKMQVLDPRWYGCALAVIYQSIRGTTQASFAFQTALDSSMVFRFSVGSNDCTWL